MTTTILKKIGELRRVMVNFVCWKFQYIYMYTKDAFNFVGI